MVWKYKLEMGQHGFVGDLDMADTLDNLSKKSVFVKGLVFHQVCHSTNTNICEVRGGTNGPTLPTSQGTC